MLWIYLQNLKFVALPVPEIIGGTQKIGQSPDTPTLPFSKTFNVLLFGWTLWMYLPNLKSVALYVPEIIAIWVLGGLRTPNHGKRRLLGVRDGIVRKSVGEFQYAVHTFPHPASSLLKISPCFPGSRWMAFNLRRANCEGVWLIVRAISF